MSGKPHCWHSGTNGFSNGVGGAWEFHCCYCGKSTMQEYRDVSRGVKGHGPHHSEHAREYQALPVDPCPKRLA